MAVDESNYAGRGQLSNKYNPALDRIPSAIPVPVEEGGTGATTAAQARVNLGIQQFLVSLEDVDIPTLTASEDGYFIVYNHDTGFFELTEVAPGGGGAVDSVFGRTGVVTASSGDYAASLITNDSGVSGSFVDDALDALDGAISAKQDSLPAGTNGHFLSLVSGSPAWVESTPGIPATTVNRIIKSTGASIRDSDLEVTHGGSSPRITRPSNGFPHVVFTADPNLLFYGGTIRTYNTSGNPGDLLSGRVVAGASYFYLPQAPIHAVGHNGVTALRVSNRLETVLGSHLDVSIDVATGNTILTTGQQGGYPTGTDILFNGKSLLLPSGGTEGQVLTIVSGSPAWATP